MGGKLILLVGPDPTQGRMIEDLTAKGNRVHVTRSVGEAVDLIQRARPALVFVNLPNRTAIEELTRAVRHDGATLPIVLLNENEEARGWARDLGVAAFAPHPSRLQGGICENLEAA